MIEHQHLFNGRYRLDTKLGEGGMATVYCGSDTLLRRRVAIKVLRQQYATDEEFVRRFYQEAESAAKLSHPNIVNTYDVGREDSTYYIVMELVDGPSLAEIISTDGKLPEPVAIDYAAQVCNGLAYAHRQGLLHRDIKPANILVTKDDVVKLSDFGIARAISQQTMTMTRPGLVMGSVYYLSPEQAQGHELHETSDLYSVGIVLYQMLTGKLPYTGESPVTVALKHISDPVPSLDADALAVSPALAAIVNKLLQKSPENRFGSAAEVASALREARERPSVAAYALHDDAPTQAIRITPPYRPSRLPDRSVRTVDGVESETVRRSGLPIVALLGIALLLAIAGGYIAYTRPFAPVQRVKVVNYVGMTDSQAQKAIVNAGLGAHLTRSPSETVAVNHVVRQEPAAGALLAKGSVITLEISGGKPSVGLPNVVGYTLSDAQRDLSGGKFDVKLVRRYDPAANDTVLAMTPAAGAKLREGSTVTLVVSNGPAPIAMPRLEGMALGAAEALAAKQGFTIKVVERAASGNIPADEIASQDIAPGTTVTGNKTTVVNVVVSTGAGSAALPDVSGTDLVTAQQRLTQAGFTTSVEYAIDPGSSDNGQIIAQQPAGGANAARGTQVMLTVSVPGEVPDTQNMDLQSAKNLLINDGYQVGNITPTTEGSGGKVVRTEPEAGIKARVGTPVNIFVNSATAQPP